MSDQDSRWFNLGLQQGRIDVIRELQKLLNLDDKIAEVLDQHERQYHNER